MLRRCRAHFVLPLLVGGLTSAAQAFCFGDETAKLVAGDATANARLGIAVAIDGDYVVAGAPGELGGPTAGAAYVFRWRSGWTQMARLIPPDGAAGDLFGFAVDISRDVAVIGAFGTDQSGSSSGSVYVYRNNGTSWVFETRLVAPDGAANDFFGYSVAVSGNVVLVGAYGVDDSGTESGAAYAFRFNGTNWAFERKIRALDGQPGDQFGYSVDLSGNTAVIGAYADDDLGPDAGAAYVFRYDGAQWLQDAKLRAGDGGPGQEFGAAVSVSGNLVVIGARSDDDAGLLSGSAYVFALGGNGWTQTAKLLAGDGAAGDAFGTAVAVAGATIVVGAPGDDDKGSNSGSAYVYRFNGAAWVRDAKIRASDGAAGDALATAVGLSEDQAVLGAFADDDAGNSSGSAYIVPGLGDCNGNNVLDLCDIAAGTSLDTNNDGFPDECVPAPCTAVEADMLRASDGAAGDWYGASVALSGRRGIIGAWLDDDFDIATGSAYIVDIGRPRAVQRAKLTAADPVSADWFGFAVAVDGDVAVVGAYGNDDRGSQAGAAYVFRFNGATWMQEAKLLAADAQAGDSFGFAVAVSGDVVVVGAYGDDDRGSNAGSAYVFRYTGGVWSQETKLLASDGLVGDEYGAAVAVSGPIILIGAREDDNNGSSSGTVYAYRYNGLSWADERRILASDGAAGDRFGWSLALDGTRAIIGALGDDDLGNNAGAAYIVEWTGTAWLERTKLRALDGAAGDEFGRAVAVAGDFALVGSRGDDDAGTDSGSAYLFVRDGTAWRPAAKLVASDGGAFDEFGRAVALSAEGILIGARGDDDLGSDAGAAYVFRGLGDCNQNDALDLCDVTDGGSLDFNTNGVPDECETGDANCDGVVSFDDIDAFVLALSGATPYALRHPDCNWLNADCNRDGQVNFNDIDAFVALIGGGF